MALMKDATSSFDVEEFMGKYNVPATYALRSKNVLDKSITLGLMEVSVKVYITECMGNVENNNSFV